MNFKNKLLLIKITNLILVISVLLFSYWYISSTYKNHIQKEFRNSIENNKNTLEGLFKVSLDILKNNKKNYKDIHQKARDTYNANPNITLNSLKQKVAERHGILSLDDFDIHLINRDKVVYKSTLENDIGYDLSQFSATAKIIDMAFQADDIQVAEQISQDILNFNYKIYSYARIDSEKILEISFVDKSTRDVLKSFESDSRPQLSYVDIEYFQIYKNNDGYFYFSKNDQNSNVKKQEMLKQATYFSNNSTVSSCSNCLSQTDTSNTSTFKDEVAQAFIQDEPVYIEDKNANILTMYSKLLTTDSSVTEYKNLVVKYQISMSERDTFLASLRKMYLWVVCMAVLVIYLVNLFINKQLFRPINLITDSIKNGNTIPTSKLKNHNDEFYIISNEYNKLLTDLKNEISENQGLANIDPLTQVGNRKAFNESFQQLVNDYAYSQQSFSVILFDIDDFKRVNSEYGHLFGDKVLKDVCDCTLGIIRTHDELYRIGSKKFMVLLPNTQVTVAQELAEKIRLGIQSQLKNNCTQRREKMNTKDTMACLVKKVTISVAVSEILPDDDYESTFTRIDALLYSAKINGKNQVKVG